jgi:hypothetical protein
MALGMGLAQNVDDTAKAFQGNPQALQQRYTQKKDLFDLLALNMIKKQQAEAKNALMMSQEKKPGTIIEQMEKELVGNAKTEMGGNTQAETASGVAGALQEKQKDSQQNMQQVANTGVAATPQGNMLNLAGGGIVGFAAGKEVPKADGMYTYTNSVTGRTNKYRKIGEDYFRVKEDGTLAKDKTTGLASANLKADDSPLVEKSDAQLAFKNIEGAGDAISRDQNSLNTGFTALSKGAGDAMPRDQNSLSGIAAVQPEVVIDKDLNNDIMGGGKPRINTAEVSNELTFDPKKAEAEVTTDPSVIRDVAYKAPVIEQNVKDIQGLTEKGITSLLTENKDRTAFTNEMMGDRRKLREEMEGKLKGRGLKEFLLGARGNTLGQTLRSGASASLAADKEADALLRGEFGDINKLGMDEFNKLADIKQKGVDTGQKYTQSEKDFSQKNSTQNLLADVNNQAKDMAAFKVKSNERLAMYDAKTKKELAVVENGLMKDRIDVQKEANSITKTNGERQGAIHILENQSKNKEVAITKARALLAKQLTNVLQFAGLEDKEVEDKKRKIKKDSEDYINKISAEYDQDIALARKIIKGLDSSNVMSAEDFRKKYASK